jgi:hypothetical protein
MTFALAGHAAAAAALDCAAIAAGDDGSCTAGCTDAAFRERTVFRVNLRGDLDGDFGGDDASGGAGDVGSVGAGGGAGVFSAAGGVASAFGTRSGGAA